MPINVNDPEYTKAEKDYFKAENLKEKLIALQKMISHAPKHKGGENLRQQLTQRRKRLEQEIKKKSKKKKGSKEGIKKGEMQAVIIGKTNSGKSSLLKILTNANPKISNIKFLTKSPTIGMMNYKNSQIQLIEIPAIEGENFDKGIIHTADTLLIILERFEDLKEIEKIISKIKGKKIVLLNKSDLISSNERRKLSAKMQSKRYNFKIISLIPPIKEDFINELKKKIFESFKIIRIFTKEPGKEKSQRPVIFKSPPTVEEVAEKILNDFSKKIKKTRIWGPSSKFAGQIVGLKHKLRDMDIVEFTLK